MKKIISLKKTSSKSIAKVINDFFVENDMTFSFNEQDCVFKFGLCVSGKIKIIQYIIFVEEDNYIVYAVSPLCADINDQKMMASMAEFVCLINYGLVRGNFEFDMCEGGLRFKSFVDCKGITPTLEMVAGSIFCPARMYEVASEGILDIICGNSTAQEAYTKCQM